MNSKISNINKQDRYGQTQLMIATFRDNFNMVERLLAEGADPNIQNKNGDTALILATTRDNADMIERLLAEGADPNIQNKNGDTALILATHLKYTLPAEILLENGANPNIQNRDGNYALLIASGNESMLIEPLLNAGADPYLEDKYGNNAFRRPYQLATRSWSPQPSLLKYFIPLLRDNRMNISEDLIFQTYLELLSGIEPMPPYVQKRIDVSGDKIRISKDVKYLPPSAVELILLENEFPRLLNGYKRYYESLYPTHIARLSVRYTLNHKMLFYQYLEDYLNKLELNKKNKNKVLEELSYLPEGSLSEIISQNTRKLSPIRRRSVSPRFQGGQEYKKGQRRFYGRRSSSGNSP